MKRIIRSLGLGMERIAAQVYMNIFFPFCLLLIDKARAKDKTYI
jgi:hypothetical protein